MCRAFGDGGWSSCGVNAATSVVLRGLGVAVRGVPFSSWIVG